MKFSNHDELFTAYVNRSDPKHKPRKVGRYWATDCYKIKKGYLTPENFFTKSHIDVKGTKMILAGIMAEDMLSKIYKGMEVDCKAGENQVKQIIQITDEIELVVKPDFVFKDKVIETKFPFASHKTGEIPDRYKDQLECEYQLLKLPTYAGFFSIPFDIELVAYSPSERRWGNICKNLISFDKDLRLFCESHPKPIS